MFQIYVAGVGTHLRVTMGRTVVAERAQNLRWIKAFFRTKRRLRAPIDLHIQDHPSYREPLWAA